MIRGVSSSNAHNINGAYLLREGLINGLPQYQSENNLGIWLVMNMEYCWGVTGTFDKGHLGFHALFNCVEKDVLLPHLAKWWLAQDGGDWVLQPGVVISKLVHLNSIIYKVNSFYCPSSVLGRLLTIVSYFNLAFLFFMTLVYRPLYLACFS